MSAVHPGGERDLASAIVNIGTVMMYDQRHHGIIVKMTTALLQRTVVLWLQHGYENCRKKTQDQLKNTAKGKHTDQMSAQLQLHSKLQTAVFVFEFHRRLFKL